jgi:hypothetical protein
MRTIKEIKEDYNLFIDIQINKYLKSVDKTEFSDEQEATLVLRRIFYTYNVTIADEHLKLTNLNREAKEKWFESIEIDFNQDNDDDISEFEDYDEFEEATESFYERFPFLPEGSIVALLFVGPALEAYGMPFERFNTLLRGEDECTEIEEDLLIWAFDLTLTIMEAVAERNKKKKEKIFNEAFIIAQQELNKEDSRKVINAIVKDIKEFEGVFIEEEQKNKKKK